jgi:hypothetical protein
MRNSPNAHYSGLLLPKSSNQMQPEASWRHKVEISASGGFIAFWENKVILGKRPHPEVSDRGGCTFVTGSV